MTFFTMRSHVRNMLRISLLNICFWKYKNICFSHQICLLRLTFHEGLLFVNKFFLKISVSKYCIGCSLSVLKRNLYILNPNFHCFGAFKLVMKTEKVNVFSSKSEHWKKKLPQTCQTSPNDGFLCCVFLFF